MRHWRAEARPYDLHVLSAPPAFVLSQDQTLSFIPAPTGPKKGRPSAPGNTQGHRGHPPERCQPTDHAAACTSPREQTTTNDEKERSGRTTLGREPQGPHRFECPSWVPPPGHERRKRYLVPPGSPFKPFFAARTGSGYHPFATEADIATQPFPPNPPPRPRQVRQDGRWNTPSADNGLV